MTATSAPKRSCTVIGGPDVAFQKILSGQLMYLCVIWSFAKKVFKIVVVWMNCSLIFVNSGIRAASCLDEVQNYSNHVGHVISYGDFC